MSGLVRTTLVLRGGKCRVFGRCPVLLGTSCIVLGCSFPSLATSTFNSAKEPHRDVRYLRDTVLVTSGCRLPVLPSLLGTTVVLRRTKRCSHSGSKLAKLLYCLPRLPGTGDKSGRL